MTLKGKDFLCPDAYMRDEPGKVWNTQKPNVKTKCVREILLGCGVWRWFEGGEGRACKNIISPNLSTQPVVSVLFFALHDYKALKASNHLLYAVNMSSETLGLRSSKI